MEVEEIKNGSDVNTWSLLARDENYQHSFTFIDDFFSVTDCEMIQQLIESDHQLEAAVTRDQKVSPDIRVSQVAWVSMQDPHSALYEKITGGVIAANQKFWHFNLSGIETIQYTVYDSELSTESRYDWHQDDGFSTTWNNSIRKLSFVCLLSDPNDFEGGELQIIVDHNHTSLPQAQGKMLFFPSPTVHRVTPVTSGTRKTLVGWVRGPCWT